MIPISFYAVFISDNHNIKEAYFPLRLFFYGELNFVIVAIEDTLDCVDFVRGDRRYNVVDISVIKRKPKGERGYTF